MINKRPTLNDPEEFEIVKSIYFKDRRTNYEDLDPVERLERLEAKQRNKHRNSQ